VSVIRVTVESSLATESVNVFHFEIADVSPVTEAQAAVDALEDYYDSIKNLLVAGTLTIGSRVVTVDQTPNSVIAAVSRTVVTTGTATEGLALAAVLSWSTGLIGPRYRGRNYLGPLGGVVISSDGRTLDGTSRNTLISNAATHLITGLTAADLVVYSRKFNTSQTITGVGMDTVAGVQRRRMR
jgi:hypothetical protein